MVPDEGTIMPIPTRRKETGRYTPDVIKIPVG